MRIARGVRRDIAVYFNEKDRIIYLADHDHDHDGPAYTNNVYLTGPATTVTKILFWYHRAKRGRYYVNGQKVSKRRFAEVAEIPVNQRWIPRDTGTYNYEGL